MGPEQSAGKTAEKQPEKHPKHAKQLFFGCLAARPAVFPAVFPALCPGPTRHLFRLFFGCFQGPALGASVAGRADRKSRLKLSENFERHWSIRISGEIHMDQSLVHTFSWGNSYGPMVLKVLLKFPPTLVLVHGWLFPANNNFRTRFGSFFGSISRFSKQFFVSI